MFIMLTPRDLCEYKNSNLNKQILLWSPTEINPFYVSPHLSLIHIILGIFYILACYKGWRSWVLLRPHKQLLSAWLYLSSKYLNAWNLKTLLLMTNFNICEHSSVQFSSVTQPCPTLESQQARPPHPSPAPGVHSDSHPSSQWCHPTISSSIIPFSSCPQSLTASESFPMSQLFAWGGQSTSLVA